MGEDGFKLWTMRAIAIFFAVLVIILGTNFFGEPSLSTVSGLVWFALAVLLFLEVGAKNVLSLGRNMRGIHLVTFIIFVVLVAGAVVSFFGFNIPSAIETLLGWVAVLAGIWIAVEAFN